MVSILISQGLKLSRSCEDEDKGMQVLVNLNFSYADSSEGTGNFQVQAIVTDTQNSTELEFKLPPITEIQDSYNCWQDNYYKLILQPKGFKKEKKNIPSSREECHKYVEILLQQLNQWLLPVKSELEKVELIKSNSEIYFVINTQNITSETITETLHKIPWREWDYFTDCDALEAALYLNETESNTPSVVDNGIFRRVRITSIFGDVENIQEGVERDKEEIGKLEKRGAELIHLQQPQRQDLKKLWDEPCDILFYSGHSNSEGNSTVGRFKINEDEDLSLEEIRNTFREAIKKGLKIAIFNSCDGLGLACELAKLGLPYIIVWRESVPDEIAQKFIEYFLGSYSNGKSLFDSVRDARIKLKELTNKADPKKQIPGLNWLPIICVSTKDEPPLWEDLGGLTGQLPDSPYQGLSAFGEEDAPYFFGREKFVGDLVEAVNTKSLVPIIGASGSGKSSVVFAGLVPRLREAHMQIVSFRPGNNPFDSLAVVLKQQTPPTRSQSLTRGGLGRLEELELEVNLENDERALCRFIKDLKTLNYQRFILIIDQFEELYTLTPETQQESFLNTLLYTVKHSPNFCLVFTLRADFYGHAISHREFSDVLQKGIYNSSPMNEAELRAVIEQPAAKMKVELESGLTDKLIDELGNQAGSLPLLEFTLSLLWDKHDKWYLTHQAYKEIGGLKQALAKYADGIINPLSVVDKEKAERIFIQLISPGEGTEDTKRQATRGEVGEDNWDLVEFLANHRLVVTGWDETSQQETVEIVHEALIREWGMLREWIKSNRGFRIWQERLQFEVVKWDKSRDEKFLLSGGNLGEAEGWYFDEKYRDYLSDFQREFIRESLGKREREEKEKLRLQRRAIKWLSGGLVAASLATGFAGWNWVKAEIASTEEKLNSSIAISQNYFNLQDYEDALFEAIKGHQLLDKTWWKQWIPTYIKQKVKIGLHQPINHSWVEEKYTLSGHNSWVNRVVFSPDGKTIASASTSWDSTVKLWNADNGKLLHTLSGNSVVFSPDGKTIALASRDGIIKLLNTNNGKLLHTLSGHQNTVFSIEFSPDGKTIASTSRDGTVKLWNADNSKLLHTLSGHQDTVWSAEFSPDGKTIASVSQDGTVKLWNADNGKLLHTLSGGSVEFSPDGKTIASVSGDNTIKLWNADNGKLLHTLSGHQDTVTSVKFSPDGKTIASASWDKTLKLWNADNGKLLNTLSGHKSKVYSLVFSPDGRTIASASRDNTAKLWNADNGKLLNTLSGHGGYVLRVVFSPDGRTIASASRDNTAKLWNIDNGKLLHTLSAHKSKVYSVEFSPDGKTIASASDDSTVKLWNADNGQLLNTLSGHQDLVLNAVFSPDGKTIASASLDKTLKLWNADNGQLLYTITGGKSYVLSVVFSPDSKVIAYASGDKTVKLWNADNGQLLNTLFGHQDRVNSVEFSPDAKVIASASDDSTVKLWNVDNGKLLNTLSGHQDMVKSVEFSPDGKVIASASWNGTIKLWNADNGQLLHTLSGHKFLVNSVIFSPDGKVIASTSWDGTVKLWNADNGQLLHTLSGHKSWVDSLESKSFGKAVKFSPDGKVIASASEDSTVKLWSVDNGQLLHTLSGHKDLVNSVEFSPDGKVIASASHDKTVKLWNWNFDNLTTRGCNRLKYYLIENPEKLEELKVCQNPEILTKAASTLVEQGEELAKSGDYESAVRKFRKAQQFHADIDLNPQTKELDNNPETVAREIEKSSPLLPLPQISVPKPPLVQPIPSSVPTPPPIPPIPPSLPTQVPPIPSPVPSSLEPDN